MLQADPADYLGQRCDPQHPLELAADGCPGGWYRTELVDDLRPFVRSRTDTGNRVQNPNFDAASWLVQDAAMYVEAEQEQARAYLHEAIARIDEAKRSRDPQRVTVTPSRPQATARPGRKRK